MLGRWAECYRAAAQFPRASSLFGQPMLATPSLRLCAANGKRLFGVNSYGSDSSLCVQTWVAAGPVSLNSMKSAYVLVVVVMD